MFTKYLKSDRNCRTSITRYTVILSAFVKDNYTVLTDHCEVDLSDLEKVHGR